VSWKIRLRALSHHVTWQLGTRLPDTFPLVFVVGYPKSGTTWACQLIADYLQLPFPKNSLLPVGCPAVVHGHETVWKSYPKAVYIARDGRDVFASLYFHLCRDFRSDPAGRTIVPGHLRRYFPGIASGGDPKDSRAHMAAFVRAQLDGPHAAPVHWGAHVQSFFDNSPKNAVLLKYEDLVSDGHAALARAMTDLTGSAADPDRVRMALDKFSFARQAGRKAGAEDRASFLRKGQAGDWVNHFTPETAAIFQERCGRALIHAGYEPDDSWVSKISAAPSTTAHQHPTGAAS
jgi:hypothetical protein